MKQDLAKEARALRDALRRMIVAHGALDDTRRPCGTPLSPPHAWALLELRDAGAMTVTELATRMCIDRTSVSRLCSRMEEHGEVERIAHPEDQRARHVKLTGHGEELAASVDATSTRHFISIASQLSLDTGDIVATLNQLTQAMSSSDTQEP